jgi:hypothetical protein
MTTKSTTPASFIITGNGKISAFVNGKAYTASKDCPNYDQILDSIRNEDWDSFVHLLDVAKAINTYAAGSGIAVTDGQITYDGEPVHNYLADKIIDFMNEGLPYKPLLAFLGNLLENFSMTAREELYLFLEKGEMPITEDGCFLAFKKVRGDFKDIHSGTFDNSPGQILEMHRYNVDDNRNNLCSAGLHFCSIDYLPCFGNDSHGTDKVVIVKINPKDVVSIPVDYQFTKGRTCKYEVLCEYTGDWKQSVEDEENGFDAPLYSSNGGDYGNKDGKKFWQKRDAKGHFVKKQ